MQPLQTIREGLMNQCCANLLNEILVFIELRQKAYEANHQFAKSYSFKLLKQDLMEKYCFEWVLSNKDT